MAASIAGSITSILGRVDKMAAATDDFLFKAEITEEKIAEMHDRNQINGHIKFLESQQITGKQVVARTGQGKGVSSSSMIAMSDTATKLARTNENANRQLNWNITNLQRDVDLAGQRAENEHKAQVQGMIQDAIGGISGAASKAPGLTQKKVATTKNSSEPVMPSILGNLVPLKSSLFS